MLELIGERFGIPDKKGRSILHIRCKCICGKIMIRQYWSAIKNRSCGCLTQQTLRERFSVHGLSKTNTYTIWYGMIRRCCDQKHKDYKSYGLRGISVSVEWRNSFETFFRDMGERPKGLSLDRIDPTGDYSKENCRWATSKEQSRNKRCNKILTIDGISKTASEWSEADGAARYATIIWRSSRGWDDEDAVFKETRQVKQNGKTGRPKKTD